MSLPKTFKRAAFHKAGGPLVIEQVPLTLPPKGEILLKVEACGVCHTDAFLQNGGMLQGGLYVLSISCSEGRRDVQKIANKRTVPESLATSSLAQ